MRFVILFLILSVAVAVLIFVLYDNSVVKECNQKYNERFDEIKNQTYNYLQDWCKKENNYGSLITYLNNQTNQMNTIKSMLQSQRYTARRLKKVYERSSEIQEISSLSNTIYGYSQKLSSLPMSKMIDNTEYGKCNRIFFDNISSLNDIEVKRGLADVVSTRSSGNYINSFRIDYIKVIQYLWFYAMKKPFDVNEYNLAVDAYRMVFCEYQKSEILLSELYYIKQLGSDNIINDKIRDLLKNNRNGDELSILASALMWMGAFSAEKIVLEHMVKSQCNLTPKQQTRLHSLANSSGNAPNSHDVASNTQEMFIDISSLSWDEDAYNAFFENLAFQDKALTYSLAVRDDTKDLMIKNPSSVPAENDVLASIKETLTSEFGNVAFAESKNTVAISGTSREKMSGVFVTSRQCNYLGILVYLVPIGRKLNIKFYTLLVPITSNNKEVKQQALSLKNNISPSATMWESSLKDSILLAIQHILNRGTYTPNPAPEKRDATGGSEVLF